MGESSGIAKSVCLKYSTLEACYKIFKVLHPNAKKKYKCFLRYWLALLHMSSVSLCTICLLVLASSSRQRFSGYHCTDSGTCCELPQDSPA